MPDLLYCFHRFVECTKSSEGLRYNGTNFLGAEKEMVSLAGRELQTDKKFQEYVQS